MISLTKNNNIYIVTLENSPVNALSLDFVSELSLLIQEIANDESTRGLLFNSSLEHVSGFFKHSISNWEP